MNTDHPGRWNRWLRRLPYWGCVALGVAAILLALVGPGLGLGADQKWGEVRIITLVAGLVVLSLAAADRTLTLLDRRLTRPERSRPADEDAAGGSRRRIVALSVMAAMLLVYFGMVTVWTFRLDPGRPGQYRSLAESFARGELALAVEADPRLAELSNPYDPEQRKGLDVRGDLSYYEGRYYLYWGPAPAALMSLWLRAGGGPVSDAVIVFLAVSALFLFSGLILLRLQRTYFPGAPPWLVALALLLLGVAHPMLWTLNSPSIYTATVSSGQAFFFAGLYFLVADLTGSQPKSWRALLGGVCWALAVASRLTLLPAVATLAVTGLALHWRAARRRQIRYTPSHALALLAPLALGLGLLGLYNFARFGDAFETGFTYQMVGSDRPASLQNGLVFNVRYLLPNLLHYLVAPLRFVSEFPFVRPWWGIYPPFQEFAARVPWMLRLSVQNAAGLLLVTPATLLAGILSVKALSFPGAGESDPLDVPPGGRRIIALRLVVLLLFGAVVALALPSLLYRVSATRFLLEFPRCWVCYLRWAHCTCSAPAVGCLRADWPSPCLL